MKFKDFQIGMVITHPPVVVDQQEIIDFAKSYDPQWFHTDPQRSEEGRWGGLIASGWFTCSLAMRMAVKAALEGSESFASPGVEKVRWLVPVRPGDSLRFEAKVESVRVSASRDDLGIVRWKWYLYNQREEQVLELEATSLFDLATSTEQTGAR